MDIINGFQVVDADHAPAEFGKGYEARDYSAYPLAGGKCASPFAQTLIDPKEVPNLIKQKTEAKSFVSDICDAQGVIVKMQAQTLYCWNNAVAHGMEVCNAFSGGANLVFSAAYVGSRIKRGRNVGGSGVEAAEWIHENGIPTEAYWKRNKVSAEQPSQECLVNAALHKIVGYTDLDAHDHRKIITSILMNTPVSVGMPAWGHEVLLTFLVYEPGKNLIPGFPGVGYGFDNSWATSWGKNGRGVLSAAYSRFDEAVSIGAVTPATV